MPDTNRTPSPYHLLCTQSDLPNGTARVNEDRGAVGVCMVGTLPPDGNWMGNSEPPGISFDQMPKLVQEKDCRPNSQGQHTLLSEQCM